MKLLLAVLVSVGLSLFVAGPASSELLAINGSGTVYTLNTTTGADTFIGANPGVGANGLTQAPSGAIYTVAGAGNLYTINPSTGVASPGATISSGNIFHSLAFSSDGTLYGIAQIAGTGRDLYRIDATTGAATRIGTPATDIPFTEIAFSPTGTLYAWSPRFSWGLSTIDLVTGQATAIGNPSRLFLTSMAFDSNGTLWGMDDATIDQTFRNRLLTIDLATGAATVMAPASRAIDIAGIQFVAPVPVPAAVWLFGSGLAAMAGVARRTRTNS